MANTGTCISSIVDDINNIPTIEPNNLTTFTGLTRTHCILYKFEIFEFQTISFMTNILAGYEGGSINVIAGIYSIDTETPISLGNSIINEQIQTFQKDIKAGKYVICLYTRTTGPFYGQITGNFYNYINWVKFDFTFYNGNYVPPLELIFRLRGISCPVPIIYELIEGELPPGLELLQGGRIQGIPENMDCREENKELSPSINWFGKVGEGKDEIWIPWGRVYRFKVKIYLPGYPLAINEQWFSIRVYNNWSLDRDKFVNNLPLSYEETHIVKTLIDPIIPIDDNSLCITQSVSKQEEISQSNSTLCEICSDNNDNKYLLLDKELPEYIIDIPTSLGEMSLSELIIWWKSQISLLDTSISPDIKEFILYLKENKDFQELLKSENYMTNDELLIKHEKEQELLLLSDVEFYLKQQKEKLISGRNITDSDFKILNNKKTTDNLFELSFYIFYGESFDITGDNLSTH